MNREESMEKLYGTGLLNPGNRLENGFLLKVQSESDVYGL